MAERRRKRCDLLVFGETTRDTITIVDSLPLPEGAAARIRSIGEPSLGGRAVNVATYAELFGADAHVLSACDRSYVAEYEKLELTAHAEMQGVFQYDEHKDTAQALIFRDAAQQVTFFYPGATIKSPTGVGTSDAEPNYKNHVRRIMKDKHSPRLVYCTSELHALVDEVMQHYSETSSVTRVFSPGPEIQRMSHEQLRRILQNTNILFLNYFEMQQIQQLMHASLSKIMRTYKLDLVVATLEHVGAIILHRSRHSGTPDTRWLPAATEGSTVLDATGAGDALAGGFLGHLITNRKKSKSKPKVEDYVEALKHGLVLASFIIESHGTLVENLSLEKVQERFQEYEARLR